MIKEIFFLQIKKLSKILIVFLIALTLLIPHLLFGATFDFKLSSDEIYEGDTFFIEARATSLEELINVVDGSILFDEDYISVQDVSTGGATFYFWAREPVFSNKEGKISFIGGTPEGFQSENGLILRANLRAEKAGETEIKFNDDFSTYLSDGDGSQTEKETLSLKISIEERPKNIEPKDEWQVFIEKDLTPPEPFITNIDNSSDLFEGRYFINFFTTDSESGVAYYEIKEGEGKFVKAKSPYVLRDQTLQSFIYIKVVDNAGNDRTLTLEPRVKSPEDKFATTSTHVSYSKGLIAGAIMLLGLIFVFVVWGLILYKRRK